MFFPNRISLLQNDRVLEVGPGAMPHPRSQVFLEKRFSDSEAARQRGGLPAVPLTKPVVYYDGGKFPFGDREFDYTICSHVIEHVDNIEQFMSELSRVAARGYIEFPTVHYEYLYNFNEHINLLRFHDGEILWMPKIETSLTDFVPIQQFFANTIERGYDDLIQSLKECFFQGFEWKDRVNVRRVRTLSDLVPPCAEIQPKSQTDIPPSGKELILELLRRIAKRVKTAGERLVGGPRRGTIR
jgi:SAM-dependent methyltransferase